MAGKISDLEELITITSAHQFEAMLAGTNYRITFANLIASLVDTTSVQSITGEKTFTHLTILEGTTSTNGIAFGGDVNLYRPFANALKTDDQIIAGLGIDFALLLRSFTSGTGGALQFSGASNGSYDVNLYASGANSLVTDDNFSAVSLTTSTSGTAVSIGSTGQIVFNTDTNLYRSAANTLKTDDNLIIAGTVTSTAGSAVTTDGGQTLTNKTLTAPIISTISNTGTLTLPAVTDTVAVLGTAQTYTATQTQKQVNFTNNAIAASSNAATVPITHRLHTVTNSSAATLTITMTTTSAVDGQFCVVRVLDFSAAAQTITWVNTENSSVTAPTTSNGSTTLFLTVGFIYNGATSKWRCIASA